MQCHRCDGLGLENHKMNTSRFRANSAMRRKGDGKANRPEQLLIAECLEHHLQPNVKVMTEELISYVTESHQVKDATLDIIVVWQSPEHASPGEYLLRVMGGYHDEPRQVKKDSLQRSYLMSLHGIRNIVTVCDLWYHMMPITFKRNRRLLNKDEAVLAYEEIRLQTHNLFWLPEKPMDTWLDSSIHIK